METRFKFSIIKWMFICLVGCPTVAFSQLTDWMNYTNGEMVTKLLNDGEYLWIATDGGLVRLTKSTGERIFYNRGHGGLPDNRLRSVAKDQDGMLWVASERKGVGKFDGKKCEVYNYSNSGLRSNSFYEVAIDKDNNPWFGSVFRLYKKEGNDWKEWRSPGSPADAYNFVQQLKFDEKGVLWLAANARSWTLARLQDDEIQPIPGISGIGNALEVDGETIWLASSNGLIKYKDEKVTTYNTDNSPLPSNSFRDVKKDRSGNLWLACGNHLLKYDGNDFESIKVLPLGYGDFINQLAIDTDGTAWMGTRRSGLYKLKEGICTQISTSNSPFTINNISSSMVMDSQNNIWFGTDQSLIKIDADDQWTNYFESVNYSYSKSKVQAVAVDPSDNIWVASDRGDTCAMKISPDGITTFTIRNSPLRNNVEHFHFDRKGNVWFGTQAGLFRFDGTDWEHYTPENSPLKSAQINCLVTDRYDNLWGGAETAEGGCLFKFDGTNWEIYTPENAGLPTRRVTELAFDPDNMLWVHCSDDGTNPSGGLTRFDGTTWQTYNTRNSGIPSNNITDIKVDKAGHLWLATYRAGIARYDGHAWTVYTTKNSGISSDEVSHITLDYYRNRLWINHLTTYGLSTAHADWGVAGISEMQANDNAVFTLYPNPASTFVNVQCKPELTGILEVCDISGKPLSRTPLKGSSVFSLQEIGLRQDGLYLVQVHTPQGRYTQKLFVQK